MKKISIITAILLLSASVLTSCNGESKKEVKKEHHKREKGHPPHEGKGDRKGPPKGGGPEQTKTLDEIGGYKIGEVATDFKLKNIDESMVSMSDYEEAKGFIVTFTCNECPFAKMYEDRLIDLHNKYAAKGYPVIAINPNSPENEKEGFAAMQVRAKEKGFPFPYLVDEGQLIYPQYGAVRTPHVFLLDKERTVKYIGTIDDNARSSEEVEVKYVENAIEALEKGEAPNPDYTKAIGCPIKANKS